MIQWSIDNIIRNDYNNMKIKDLVEYSSDHKNKIENAEKLGFDSTSYQNPDLSEDIIDSLYRFQLYNIKVDPKHIDMIINGYPLDLTYLQNGYCSVQNIKQSTYRDISTLISISDRLKFPLQDTDYSDSHGFYKRLGEYRIGQSFEPQLNYTDYVTEYFLSWSNDIKSSLSSSFEKMKLYYHQKGSKYLIDDFSYDSENLSKVELYSQGFDDFDNVMDLLERDDSEFHLGLILEYVQFEYKMTGRCSFLIDERYSTNHRMVMFDIYESTGIDIRFANEKVIDDILNEYTDPYMYSDYHFDFVNLISNKFTLDEIRELRLLSNQFREDRLTQVKHQESERYAR